MTSRMMATNSGPENEKENSSAMMSTTTDIEKEEEELVETQEPEVAKKQQRPRQWIYDRVDGVSKQCYDDEECDDLRPPCALCFPSPLLKCCPFLLEENWICTTFGGIGCTQTKSARIIIGRFSLMMNILGLLCTCYAALAVSEYIPILEVSSWNTGELVSTSGEPVLDPITLDVGIMGVAINNPNTFGKAYVPFHKFCDLVGNGIEKYIDIDTTGKSTTTTLNIDGNNCDTCNEVSIQILIVIGIALYTYHYTIVTDVTRLYANYDTNCTKLYGNLFALCTLAGCVVAYYQFTESCMESFHDGLVHFTKDGTVISSENDKFSATAVILYFDWAIGYGMIGLFCGFGCKCINFISSCFIIPTPTITRR